MEAPPGAILLFFRIYADVRRFRLTAKCSVFPHLCGRQAEPPDCKMLNKEPALAGGLRSSLTGGLADCIFS